MYDYIQGLPESDEGRKEVRRRKPDSLDAAMKDAEEAEQLLSGGRKKDYGGQGRDGRFGSDSHLPLRPQSQSNNRPFQWNPPQWSQRQQHNAPPRGMYSTTGGRTGWKGKLITFYSTANGILIRALWDPGADSIYVSKRVVEAGKFRLSALEPSTCKGGIRLDGMQALSTTVQ
uniref:Uncharacterized protein n=1 Tax=Chromera velia CCMP2878 TaxID=1169474 RepID=A0A0G4HPF0_9ALVE|eukprot:Cvel_7769.t1-p1 / transcript=Cvel_7769.t1 / gene=Cvel_7769 / organism=Chromera_velia_CCMP2878 / gene_product=hypothetical protein / transcript_product=hypothetical protein / location=Cvel_scaffold414:7030-7869(-) / protein_length=172 / sequence_SO=supercontig / SO=protein_coding / is_pseudo=false